MSINKIYTLFGVFLFVVALVMFYKVGGWMLVGAAFLFGWAMNIDNSAKRQQ